MQIEIPEDFDWDNKRCLMVRNSEEQNCAECEYHGIFMAEEVCYYTPPEWIAACFVIKKTEGS